MRSEKGRVYTSDAQARSLLKIFTKKTCEGGIEIGSIVLFSLLIFI